MRNPKTKSRLAAIPRLISRPALLEMLGIGPSALHDWSINRDFPAAIELGPPRSALRQDCLGRIRSPRLDRI